MLLNLGINLKHGGAGRARFRGEQAYLFVFKGFYAPETPCISGSGAGGEAVDSFTSSQNRLFYPQIVHDLCISHTDVLWTAWNAAPEFLEICGTLGCSAPQISSNQRIGSPAALRGIARRGLAKAKMC